MRVRLLCYFVAMHRHSTIELIFCSCLQELSIFLIAILMSLPSHLKYVSTVWALFHIIFIKIGERKICLNYFYYYYHFILLAVFVCEHRKLLYWNTNGHFSKPLSWKPGCEASIPSFSLSLFLHVFVYLSIILVFDLQVSPTSSLEDIRHKHIFRFFCSCFWKFFNDACADKGQQ